MNPHVRPPESILTEADAIVAIFELSECYGIPFIKLLRDFRTDKTRYTSILMAKIQSFFTDPEERVDG